MLRGYRLHDKRIDYSRGTGSMRSIKYELVDSPAQPGMQAAVSSAVEHDYHGMYGRMSVADWLGDTSYPSMLGFWLHCLRLGVWFGKNESTADAAFAQYKGRPVGWYARYAQLSEQARQTLDNRAWCEFMGKSQRGLEGKSPEARERIILNLGAKDLTTEQSEWLAGMAREFSSGITAASDKELFKAQLFGVEPVEAIKLDFALTWTLDPDVPEVPLPDVDEVTPFIESVLQRYQSATFDAVEAIAMMGIGSNGNYLNNVFGSAAGYLLDGKAEAIARQIASVHGYDDQRQAVITERLLFLADYLQLLGSPRMTRRWAEYRGDFNGTLESWFSNRRSKHDTAIDQLVAVRKAAAAVVDAPALSGSSVVPLAEELVAVITEALSDGAVVQEETFTIRTLMGELRSELNAWLQLQPKTEHKDLRDLQTTLGANVQSAPLFFGVSQAQRYQKLRTAKQVVLGQLDTLAALYDAAVTHVQPEDRVADRTVDTLARVAQRADDDHVQNACAAIEQLLACSFADRTDKNRFYLSGFEQQEGLRKLPYTARSVADLLATADVPHLIEYLCAHIASSVALRDGIALLKPLVAAAIASLPDDYEIPTSLLADAELTDREADLLKRAGKHGVLPAKTSSLLSVYIFAELSGFAALVSRDTFVVRSAVQATNGSQMTLGYETYEKADNTHRRYYVQAREAVPAAPYAGDELMLTRQPFNYDHTAFAPSQRPKGAILSIRSSRYQIQFLEWFLGFTPRRTATLRAGGAFSIVERSATIDWSGEEPVITLDDKARLFISQPFTIVPPDTERQTRPNRFMGVDIGEYVLAWYVIEVDDHAVRKIASGVIEDGQHRALASRVRQLKDRQVRATFSMPSTRVARLRESLTGTYRNALESLAMKYGARLCFEYEVSAFESGGRRITKVYDSIKRADVLYGKDGLNKAANVQAWGKAKKADHTWAAEITAAGTSQTCSRCRRWTSLAIHEKHQYALKPHTIPGLYTTTLNDGAEVVCFAPKGTAQLTGRDLKRAIYKAMRPNLGGAAMNLIAEPLRQLINEDWKAKRGNIAVYVCPYRDCHHVSDADVQAALNIALRGYMKTAATGAEHKFTVDWFMAELAKCSYEPAGLSV